MDKIQDVLEADSANSKYLPTIKSALRASIKLLARYYTLTNRSVVYKFATSQSTWLSLTLTTF